MKGDWAHGRVPKNRLCKLNGHLPGIELSYLPNGTGVLPICITILVFQRAQPMRSRCRKRPHDLSQIIKYNII